MSQSVIATPQGLVRGSTDISASMLDNLEATLEAMEVGPLLGLWLQSFLIHITMLALNIIIFVIVYGRMIEIYLLTSLAPIPVATLSNREIGSMGQNYIKSLFAVGFQGLLILVCVAIYAVLVQGIATSAIPSGRSGAASAIRCCCASPCSKLARWQRAYSARIKKGQRHEQNHFGKQGVPRKVGRLCGERRRNGAGGFRDKLSRSSRAEFVPTSPKGPGWPGVGAQRPVPYGRDRGLALLAPSFGGYAFDRSPIRHDPELLGCAGCR